MAQTREREEREKEHSWKEEGGKKDTHRAGYTLYVRKAQAVMAIPSNIVAKKKYPTLSLKQIGTIETSLAAQSMVKLSLLMII